jgi:hypothetical protein
MTLTLDLGKHFNSVDSFNWTMLIEQYSIFRTSLLWFIWAISVLHMVCFSGPFHALRCRSGSAGRCLLHNSLGGFAAVQQ